MTEEEMESGITPEVLPSKDLAVIIKETGLEESLAQEFTINFEEHFRMASEWAKKAKKIIVTDASQQVVMQEARTAMLFLREKRLEIEKFRVSRKEYFLKGGRAIDKVANFLKDTIIPIEEHLDRQEHYVELMKKAEDARILAEAHAKQEAEIKAKEESDRIALKQAQEENEKLRKEAEKVKKEAEQARRLDEQRIREMEREISLKREAEAKAEADRIKAEEALKSAGDGEKLWAFRKAVEAINIPDVKSEDNKRLIAEAKNYLNLAIYKIRLPEEE